MHRLTGAILSGILLWSLPAQAEPTRRELLIAGASVTAGTTVLHGVVWSLYADRRSSIAPHLVPIVGPIVGFRELANTPCLDERHGCPLRGMIYIYDSLFLASQVGGVGVMTAAAFRSPDVAVRGAPGMVTVHWRW